MEASDYLELIESHPNKALIEYKNSSSYGVFELVPIEVFQDGVMRIFEKKLYFITSYLSEPINKKTDPTMIIDGSTYTMVDHYQENKFITVCIFK